MSLKIVINLMIVINLFKLFLLQEEFNMKKLPALYTRKEECCGCTACYAICPKNAIIMVSDDEGFEYPKIDKFKCVCCYKCVTVCPFKISNKNNEQ